MTRVEKYRLYREEINNEAFTIEEINKGRETIAKYKEIIYKINPAILPKEESVAARNPIIDETSATKNKDELEKMGLIIDKEELNKYYKKCNDFFSSYKSNSILNAEQEISQEWLLNDPNYQELCKIGNNIEQCSHGEEILENYNKKMIELSDKKNYDFSKNVVEIEKICELEEIDFKKIAKKKRFIILFTLCVIILLALAILSVFAIYEIK